MSVFSNIPPEEFVFESSLFFCIYDRFPVSKGHILIISKAQKSDFFDLSEEERIDLQKCIFTAKSIIEKSFNPNGYNIGMNCGEAAGQTVMHFHCHIMPRYFGDMEDPRGGVRHCIQGKGYYHSIE